MIGREIGNYRIVEKMGEGGMGVVYKAFDTQLDRVVAVKALHPQFSADPDLVERFRAEARTHAQMNHPNVATLYAFLAEDDVAYMVMEFVEGETFDKIVARRGPIPAGEAVPLFRQALAGIGYAHHLGIVHRDIKPANIILGSDGIVKVMDFGLAKVLGNRGLTGSGVRLGTVYYMSPEQVRNKPVDIRSDIYSLGATLFEILTARAPFQGESDFHVLNAHVNTPAPKPSGLCPFIPAAVENAVLKALAKNPGDRFRNVQEFRAALEQPGDPASMAETSILPAPVSEVVTTITRQPKPASPAHRGRIAALAPAIIALLIAGWLILRPSARRPGAVPPAVATAAPPSAPAAVPAITIPAGTIIRVRTLDPIDGQADRVGQEFEAWIADPVEVDGRTAIRARDGARLRLQDAAAVPHAHKKDLLVALAGIRTQGHDYDVTSTPYLMKGGFFHHKRVAAGTEIEFTLAAPVTISTE
ncbi:MAG TPA: serine/threonine-protein kinase [Bryobacteraceae bacterium]|nr:serine/threonine-protein kinase [Bryobacteraceae bacterium]